MSRLVTSFASSAIIANLLFQPVAALAQDAQASSRPAVPITQEGGIPVRNDFQVSPTRFTLEMDPGEQRTIDISVISRSGEPYTFSSLTEDFAWDEKEDIHLFGSRDGPFSARRWAVPNIGSVTLSHGERATIPVTVTVPQNASVGDHYVAVLFQRDPKEGPQAGFNIIARVGVLVLVTVKGPVVKQGNLQEFRSLLPVYWWLPSTFALRYKNEGTVHLIPSGTVKIKNIFGIVVDEIPVKDWYVLRNSVRLRNITWNPKFALGYYKATVNVKTDANPDAEEMSSSFWIIPLVPVSLALVAIFLVSFIVQFFFSRFEVRKRRR